MKRIDYLVLLSIPALYLSSVAAEVYQCTDASGQAVFQQTPCFSDQRPSSFKPISVVPNETSELKKPKHSRKLKTNSRKKRGSKKRKKQKRATESYCNRLKARINTIQSQLRAGTSSYSKFQKLRKKRTALDSTYIRKCP